MPGPGKDDAPLVFVATRFHSLARRPGGIPREQAIETAAAHLDRLRPDFARWLDQELRLLIQTIPADRAAVASDDPWLETAYQHCRAVRDVGATMGFDLITFAANNLCDIFEVMRAGIECPTDVIDSQVQALLLARQEVGRPRPARRAGAKPGGQG